MSATHQPFADQGSSMKVQRSDKYIWGEFASRTFRMRPELPNIGSFHRMRELAVTAPKPKLQIVLMSLLMIN